MSLPNYPGLHDELKKRLLCPCETPLLCTYTFDRHLAESTRLLLGCLLTSRYGWTPPWRIGWLEVSMN